ncbi:MAG: rhomboid family intramembrane serine protease [Flavobacteriales bacterium]|nr:rhomboid family intramembrane serine protease [Flavobacteriales bacterium]
MLEDLKRLFKGNNFLGQIILINAGVFLIVNLVSSIFLKGNERLIQEWIGLPALLGEAITVPWTFFTYMFSHGSLWHLIFNMYLLFWFGRIFGSMMGEKRLIGLYFLSGLAGGLLYFLVFNVLFLAGEPVGGMILIGASGAIMGIVIAAGARFPDYVLNLFLLGAVPLKYVALAIFIISTLLDFNVNMGGKIAHIGGAAMGYFYVRGLNNGKDYAMAFMEWIDKALDMFKQKPKLRMVPNDRGKSSSGSSQKKSSKAAASGGHKSDEHQAKTDAILDKISKSGYENLTREEKDFLFKLSNKP